MISVQRSQPLTASDAHVTARELDAVPMRSAEDALKLVPGFTLVQHGSEGKGHQFFLRGFDAIHGADLELTVEGIPINEWSNVHAQGYIDLGFVIAEAIRSVEVIKGPFSVNQGAFAMAGSAEYRLGLGPDSLGVRTSYTIGTTNRHRGVVTYSPVSGDGSEFIALEALHDDGFGQNRGIERGAVFGRLHLLDTASSGTLSLLGSGYLARFELPGSVRTEDQRGGRLGFYDVYDRAGAGRSGRGLLALAYERREGDDPIRAQLFGGYRELDLLENFTGFLIDPMSGDRRAQDQRTVSLGGNVSFDTALLETLRLRLGLGVRADAFDQGQDHVDQAEVVLEPERRLEGTQSLWHALAGVEWLGLPRLRMLGGVRFDLARVSVNDALAAGPSGSDTLGAVSPRLSLEARLTDDWRLSLAYGRGFRPPEARAFSSFEPEQTGISDDLYRGGDPAMTTSDSFELGTRLGTHRELELRASAFATFIERESIFDHVSGVNLELNRTRRLGTEVEAHVRPLPWLDVSADATWVDARFVESGNPIPLAPWLSGGLRGIADAGAGFNAGLRLLGLAPRPLPHGARGSTLLLVDASAGYRHGAWRVELEVENLLNLKLREGEYHYASHWQRDQAPSQLPVLHYTAGPPLNARLTASLVF